MNDFKWRHFEVMRALKKGQAKPWQYQKGVLGEARLVERAFGIGDDAMAEAMTLLEAAMGTAAIAA